MSRYAMSVTFAPIQSKSIQLKQNMMKNRLFYLIGTALLLCSTGTFTSCINGVDDEYLDQKNIGGGSAKDDESELPDLNGEYSENGDFELKMTYNGEKMGGKKVIVMADEKLETATFTLA